ncbi:response regulator transcription factor [Phosphitispora fastidiosa]|uniref:response regulator transcription factor n=1 Tax=Phosphitispora fastidiosa TaxID=2837202 RepID=UPI001E45BFE3|nr:response regulator transcription factor [Phosphitispora fastidiosa]MBU7007106.1 DNA-binding response OmpR family regulator [Phosphitispora fastidiosa]
MIGKVLLIDSEAESRDLVTIYLTREGFLVVTHGEGTTALDIFDKIRPDLVILEVNLSGLDGYEVCRRLRYNTQVPIIFLSHRSDLTDIVLGLGLGANDYVAKPFNPVELAARVRAQLLRYKTLCEQSVTKPSILRFNDLEIDINARELKQNNSRIDLSAKEFDLLAELASCPNKVFTIEELFEKIWGYDNDADCRTVTVHLGKLRKKIEQDPSSPHYIVNVRGVGYKLKTN